MNVTLPRVRAEEARQFLELLDPEAKRFYFQTFDDAIVDGKRRKNGKLVVSKFDDFDNICPRLIALNQQGAGVYVTVNETDEHGREKENITRPRAIWGDFDDGFPSKWPLPPSIIVKTSVVNGVQKGQAYWLIDESEGISPEEHQGMILRIVRSHGGCPGATLYNQVLRIPGFYHQKNQEFPQLIEYSVPFLTPEGLVPIYTRSELLKAFPPVPKKPPLLPTEQRDVPLFDLDLPSSIEDVRFFLKHNAPIAIEGAGGDLTTYKVAAICRAKGVSQEMALELMTEGDNESWNGRCQPPWDIGELEVKVKNGFTHGNSQPGAESMWFEFEDVFNSESPPATLTSLTSEQTTNKFRARIKPPGDLNSIPARPWMAKGRLMRQRLALMIAPGGVGKSLLSLTWFIAFARGNGDFIGLDIVGGPKKVLSINLEDDIDEQKRRLKATLDHFGIDPEEIGGLDENCRIQFFDARGVGFKIVARKNRELVRHEDLRALLDVLREDKFEVVGIDPLVETHDANENDNAEMAKVMAAIRNVVELANAAGLLIHHTAKPPMASSESYAGNQNAGRGASAVVNAVRMAFTLFSMTKTEGEALGIPENLRRYYSRLDDAKANYHLGTGDAVWLRRVSVALPNGDDVGVYELAKIANAERVKAVSHFVLDTVKAALASGVSLSPKPQARNNIIKYLFEAQKGVTDYARDEIERAVDLYEAAEVFETEEYEVKGHSHARYKLGAAVDLPGSET